MKDQLSGASVAFVHVADRERAMAFYRGVLGIWTSPDGRTRVAFFADPDGNVLTLSQA